MGFYVPEDDIIHTYRHGKPQVLLSGQLYGPATLPLSQMRPPREHWIEGWVGP
jgi:hypothetical protein